MKDNIIKQYEYVKGQTYDICNLFGCKIIIMMYYNKNVLSINKLTKFRHLK